MYDVVTDASKTIFIGYAGERYAKSAEFDLSAWAEQYGGGNLIIRVQRPTEKRQYDVVPYQNETVWTWAFTDTDTELTGTGACQLLYYVGDVLKKSAVFATRVSQSLGSAGDTPEPYVGFLEQVEQLAADAEDAATRAEAAAERAAHGGLPPGGTAGQLLIKRSETDGDAAWSDIESVLPEYGGDFDVTPLANAETTLNTARQYLAGNIVIKAIPYQKTSNLSGGYTATIGG